MDTELATRHCNGTSQEASHGGLSKLMKAHDNKSRFCVLLPRTMPKAVNTIDR